MDTHLGKMNATKFFLPKTSPITEFRGCILNFQKHPNFVHVVAKKPSFCPKTSPILHVVAIYNTP
jgi:hypothetical protein